MNSEADALFATLMPEISALRVSLGWCSIGAIH
jgi:hypothetical protein